MQSFYDDAPKTPLWQAIGDEVRGDIAAGRYKPGDKLPTEVALASRFGVNRHTVRHALAALVDEGLIHTRRGAGAFVTTRPVDYPLGRRVRFHQNLVAAGQTPDRQVTGLEGRSADETEARMLELAPGGKVYCYDGLSLADGQPVALFRSVFPAARFPGLLDILRKERSVTRSLALCGVPDYTRRSTRLTARLASATQALNLRIREGAPILMSSSLNIDPDGRPVEFGLTWFAGEKVALTLTEKDF